MCKKTWLVPVLAFFVLLVLVAVTALNAVELETNVYTISNDFDNISLVTDTADITFDIAEDDKCTVVCHEQRNVRHSAIVEENTLSIKVVDERKWYEHIGIFVESPKLTVYMPAGVYRSISISEDTGDIEIPKDFSFRHIDISTSTGDVKNYASAEEYVKLMTSTGNMHIENICANLLDLSASAGNVKVSNVDCAGDVKIKVTTGKVSATDITCNSVLSYGDTGDMILENVIAAEKISIERSTGDVKLEGCDAAEILVETDTGNVTGSLLTDKVFITETDTGRVSVPKTSTGGKCEISTDTGNIKINISQE